MDWLEIVQWYREAFELQRAEAHFKAQLAGARLR